ncbi:MAG: AraC family transcriptional regulator [Fimbriimonadales bacterium]
MANDVSGYVSFGDVTAMVKLGQRTELEAYFRQFLGDLKPLAQSDLRLAKARFLTLVTTLVTSVLEIGAPREMEATIAMAAEDATGAQDAQQLHLIAERYLSHATVCARPNANRFAEQTIERCRQVIAESYSQPLNDEKLAEQVGLSRSHFRYLFKEITGMPFKRYLSQVRLTAAKQMITDTRMSIREVCFTVGYGDLSSFYRAYRAYHGVAPTADRHAAF